MNPQIYAVDLASYLSGNTFEKWIDANQDAYDIEQEINQMLTESPEKDSEEWAIHAYKDFGNADSFLGENPELKDISKAGMFISEQGEIATLLIEHYNGNIDGAESALENKYIGEYKSMKSYIEEELEQRNDIPDDLQRYIDTDYMARDYDKNGEYFSLDSETNTIYLFSNL